MFKIFRAEVGFRDMGLNVTWATAYSDGQFSFVASQTKKPMSKGAEEEGRSKEGMLLSGSWFPGQLIEGDGGVGRAAFHLINSPKIVSSRKFLELSQSLQVPRVGLQVTNGARSSCEPPPTAGCQSFNFISTSNGLDFISCSFGKHSMMNTKKAARSHLLISLLHT